MSGPPRNFFDVVVLGSDPGGLVCAALLSRKGYRVAVLPAAQAPVTPLLVPGGRGAAVLGWVFSQLGLMQEMRNHLSRLDPSLQVVLPRHRLDLASGSSSSLGELRREFPGDIEIVQRWLERITAIREWTDQLLDPPPILPADSMRDQRQWRTRLRSAGLDPSSLEEIDFLRLLPGGHPLRVIAPAAVRFLAAVDPPARSGIGPPRLLSLIEDGVWVFEDGRAGFLATMMERLSTYGAAIIESGPALEIEPSWRGEAMVRTEKEPIGTRVIVHAGDARELPSLLPSGGKRRKLEALLDEVREVGRRSCLQVRARAAARPAGLGPLAVLDPQDGAPPVLVRTTEQGDECLFTVVYDEPTDRDPEQPPPATRAEALLRWVVPFLDEHLLETGSDRGVGVPLYAAAPMGGDGGVSLLPCRTPYRQVFLAGHQVLPGLGLEGDFLAGVACAEQVARQVKRKDLLSK